MILELDKAQKFKQRLRAGEPCLGAQLALSDSAVAEIFGHAGYHWLVIDTEHSASNTQTVKAMLQAAVHTPAVCLARPLRLDVDEIRRFLDLGSPGLICPFINSGAEARQLVQACRYPPAGIRGFGPRRAHVYGLEAKEYFAQVNECVICIPIIESKEAVEHIEEIVAVDGIDGACIGQNDLSISLGCFRSFQDPAFLSAVETVRKACRKYKKASGSGCYSLEHAKSCIQAGDTLVLAAGDDVFLAGEAKRAMQLVMGSSRN